MQELGLGAVDPALEQSCRAAAGGALGPRELLGVEPENLADARGNAEWREESGRMKAAAMELPRRDAADATRDLIGDGDREDELEAGHRAQAGEREGRRHRRAT